MRSKWNDKRLNEFIWYKVCLKPREGLTLALFAHGDQGFLFHPRKRFEIVQVVPIIAAGSPE